jgi:L-glutamine-phosphate cytidylyltransferase
MKDRALILAAGRGSRMGKETLSKPKCFTLLNGKRLLDWQLLALTTAGIDDITIITGYRSEMFIGLLPTIYNKRWGETNMVGSLFCANSVDGNTIISYSDIVYKKEHIDCLAKSKSDITITADKEWASLWLQRFDDPLDDAETFKSNNGVLIEIGGKTNNISEIEAQFMGLLNLTQNGWKIMFELYQSLSENRKDALDMTGLLNLVLINGINVSVVLINGGWCEIDEYSDILTYEKIINENNKWSHDWR